MAIMDPEQKKTGTVIHKRLLEVLEALDLDVGEEVGFPPYTVDMYLPSLHVAFEADGPRHQGKMDERRDLRLMANYALPVYRFNTEDLAGDTEARTVVVLRKVLSQVWRPSAIDRRVTARENE